MCRQQMVTWTCASQYRIPQDFRAQLNAEILVTSCLLNWRGCNYFLYEPLLKTLEKWPLRNFITSYYILSLILRAGAGLYQRHLSTCDKRKKDTGQENDKSPEEKTLVFCSVSNHQCLLMWWTVHLDIGGQDLSALLVGCLIARKKKKTRM